MNNESTEKAKDFMYAWRLGWPEYIPNEKDDLQAILKLADCSFEVHLIGRQ